MNEFKRYEKKEIEINNSDEFSYHQIECVISERLCETIERTNYSHLLKTNKKSDFNEMSYLDEIIYSKVS